MTITAAIKNRGAAVREPVVQNKSKEPECNISGFRADHRPFPISKQDAVIGQH